MPKGKVKPKTPVVTKFMVGDKVRVKHGIRDTGLPGHATWRLGRDHLRNPRPRHAHRPLEPGDTGRHQPDIQETM